jgi:germination protein M
MARGKRGRLLGRTGCLFWLLILIVIVIVILYRGKGSFRDAFSFLKRDVKKTTAVAEESFKTEEDEEKIPAPTIIEDEEAVLPPKKEPVKERDKESATAQEESKQPQREKPLSAPEQAIKTKSLNATLYFVKIDETDGSAKAIPVKRTVEYKDSPITRTMEALLAGSSKGEKESGIISFIPEGTKLISAKISEGHLTLNFTGRLEENYSGREAILLELSQIILTSFSFDAVQRVSILIDGQRKGYITGEGIPLKQYYTRQDISLLISGG